MIRELLRELSDCLGENGEFEARELLMYVTGMSLTEVTLNRNSEIPADKEREIRSLAARRMSGEPLQYIIGTAEFMGLEFAVTPDTLIPRQDTETLVEAVLPYAKGTVLDIGCGTGCIGISIAHFTDAEVTLLDVSEAALKIAAENAERNNVSVHCIKCDILNDMPEGKFDMIVSNPPYIRTDVIETLDTDVKDHEPRAALDGGEDGLVFYRRITDIAEKLLSDGGILAYEIGFDQGREVLEIVKDKFINARLIRDYCGNDRVIIAEKKNV